MKMENLVENLKISFQQLCFDSLREVENVGETNTTEGTKAISI